LRHKSRGVRSDEKKARISAINPRLAMTSFDEEENHTETDTDSNGGGLTNFSVKVNVDRDGFFRRTCPACGRDFKTAINESDLASVLTPEIERIGRELGITSDENNEDRETKLTCPYCASQANISKMTHGNDSPLCSAEHKGESLPWVIFIMISFSISVIRITLPHSPFFLSGRSP